MFEPLRQSRLPSLAIASTRQGVEAPSVATAVTTAAQRRRRSQAAKRAGCLAIYRAIPKGREFDIAGLWCAVGPRHAPHRLSELCINQNIALARTLNLARLPLQSTQTGKSPRRSVGRHLVLGIRRPRVQARIKLSRGVPRLLPPPDSTRRRFISFFSFLPCPFCISRLGWR